MATISQNQYDYLNGLVKSGGGNGEWAKSQLNGATVAKPQTTTNTGIPKTTQNPVGNNGFTPTPYSQGNNFGAGSSTSNTSTPPAITAAANPQTNKSGQTQQPSWMGNQYGQVQGTDWYSTNPTNPNASKYRADGSPVASIGLSDDKGFKFDGYGSPEQFKQITDMVAGNNVAGVDQLVRGWINDGKLISNDSIYNNINKVVNSNTSKDPAITAAASYTPEKNYGTLIPTNQIGVGALGYDPNNPIVSSIMNGVNQQTSAINQGLNLSQQANNAQVSENNRYKDENTAKLTKQKSQDLDNAVQFQNRRGGFYSGGLDYQQGAINNGYQEAVGGLERDTAARNNAIWSNNAALAKNASDNIAMLLQQAPEKIQAALTAAAEKQAEAKAKERQQNLDNAVKVAGVTGYYQDPMVQEVQQKMAQNSDAWFNANATERARLAAENQQLGASIGAYQDAQGNWLAPEPPPTLAREKQKYDQVYEKYRDEVKDAQWLSDFDRDNEQWGLEFAVDKAYKAGQLSIQQRNSAISEAKEARLASGASSKAAKETESGGAKVSSTQFNDAFKTLQQKYGVARYRESGKDSKGNPIYDESAPPTYVNSTNPDQQAKIVTEVLQLGLNDEQTLQMWNKLGITEEQARQLLGG
ncbi:hypothetical protein QFZ77_002458 [Paenibacillus sp. V4I3]|uniref:hypothetical protein n=1 Tax=Paenibacillus sp. V4I3 TaxID=3042305 RepID=UPI00278BA90A|nr:hypothetical protein [Paenibacillus sp. V4I3]MDQ0873799.1 hypothetical protein [Paenibacillus sp. V4I3]